MVWYRTVGPKVGALERWSSEEPEQVATASELPTTGSHHDPLSLLLEVGSHTDPPHNPLSLFLEVRSTQTYNYWVFDITAR